MQGSSGKASLRRELGVGQDESVVLTVGRLSHEKAHADLVAALSHLREAVPVRLIIVGEGPERKRIEETARGLGADRRVTLTGFLSDPRPYYAIADVFAMSSLTEGSPMALLEAMAARVPVVATAVGGIPEIVQDGESALLVPPRDPAALATALARALSEPEQSRRRAEQAFSALKERHSPQARVRAVARLYRDLAKQHAHRH